MSPPAKGLMFVDTLYSLYHDISCAEPQLAACCLEFLSQTF